MAEGKSLFKRSNDFSNSSLNETTPIEENPDIQSENPTPFQLNEFVSNTQSVKRKFTFDSEQARNFEVSNVKKAREGVKEIFADAMEKIKVQADNIRSQSKKDGYDEGFAEGFKAGESNAAKEFMPFITTTQNLIEELSKFRKQMFPKVEREMLEMIVGISKKILQVELENKENSIQDIIRLAVQSILDRETMTIKVHPTDKGYVDKYKPELKEQFQDVHNLKIEGHTSVPQGHCLIDSNFGTIHAGIETLHDQIEKILNTAPIPEESTSFETNE